VQMASVGVHTIASPRRLNDVFMHNRHARAFSELVDQSPVKRLISLSTVCGRALPSTCVTRGNHAAFLRTYLRGKDHKRRIRRTLQILSSCFPFERRRKWRHHSRNFTALFTFAFISGSRGSARIDLFPSARGPIPFGLETIQESFLVTKAQPQSKLGRKLVCTAVCNSEACLRLLVSSKDGPQYPCRIVLIGIFPLLSRYGARAAPSATPSSEAAG